MRQKLIVVVTMLLVAMVLWAADLTGTWTADVVLDAGSGTATFVFDQKGEALTGTYAGTLGEAKIAGTIKGDQVEWGFDGGQAGPVSYKGTLDEASSTIKGTTQYGQLGSGTFTAKKK